MEAQTHTTPFPTLTSLSHTHLTLTINSNGRKCITTVAGLADDLDMKRICKAFKKNFSCNGAVQKDEEVGEVIQLSGDQRTNVQEFLVDQEICLKDSIILHGF